MGVPVVAGSIVGFDGARQLLAPSSMVDDPRSTFVRTVVFDARWPHEVRIGAAATP